MRHEQFNSVIMHLYITVFGSFVVKGLSNMVFRMGAVHLYEINDNKVEFAYTTDDWITIRFCHLSNKDISVD